MTRNKLKLMAFTCAAAMTFASANTAMAQTADVPVALITSSALTVTDGVGMDFGTWFLRPVNDDFITLVLDPTTGATTPTVDDGVDTTADGSAAVDIGTVSTPGTFTVQSPAAATLSVFATLTDFTDAALALTLPTYELNGTGGTVAFGVGAVNATTFVSTGAVDDTFAVGATVTAIESGGQPPADNTHGGNIQLTLSY